MVMESLSQQRSCDNLAVGLSSCSHASTTQPPTAAAAHLFTSLVLDCAQSPPELAVLPIAFGWPLSSDMTLEECGITSCGAAC